MNRFSRLMHRLHRALGSVFAVLVALWFASGAVMTFADYPELSERERLALAPPLPRDRALLLPARLTQFVAAGGLAHGARVRLTMLEGKPTWLYEDRGVPVALRAQGTDSVTPLDLSRVRAEASRRFALPVESALLLTESDQWTVALARPGVLPLYRVRFADLARTEGYFSARTGELLQRSTASERTLAWLGPIPHWVYPTLLRRERALWRYTVLGLCALCLVLTLSGTVAGVHVWRRLRKRAAPARDPYLRWHQTLGLWFGLFASSWLFSGALSLTPFQWTGPSEPSAREQSALYDAQTPRASYATLSAARVEAAVSGCQRELAVRELALTALAGRLYAVCADARAQTRLVALAEQAPRLHRVLPRAVLSELAERLAGAGSPHSLTVREAFDAYHYPTHGRPDAALPYARIALSDDARTTYYVDPARALLLQKHTARTRLERWLYHGLHSFDLPGLYQQRVLWRTLMLTAMALGTALAGLGLTMTLRRRSRAALRRRRRDRRAVGAVTSAVSTRVADPVDQS